MQSRLTLIASWLAAVTVALTLSWVAVSAVRDRVIQPSRVVPTTIVAVDVEPEVVFVDPEVADPDDPDTSIAAAPTSTTSVGTDTIEPRAETTTTQRTTSPAAPAATTPTATSSTTTTTAPQPPPAPASSTTSHTVVGGVVTIRSSPETVTFVSAIPQGGYTVEIRETGPDRVRVRFVSSDHTSDFEAEWEDRRLDITTSESGDDDD